MPRNDYKDLARLYEGGSRDGSPATLQRRSTSRWRRFTMVLFFLLAAASVAVWFGAKFFQPFAQQSGGLKLAIDAPDSSRVGSTITYHLRFTNQTAAVIPGVSLRVNYPDGFHWLSATLSPDDAAHAHWSFPSLASGETKTIDVTGQLFGDPGTIRTTFATATYHLPSFRSELETTASAGTKLDPAVVQLTWSGPSQASPGDRGTYQLAYENHGDQAMPAAVLTLNLSPNFTVSKADPAPTTAALYHWPVPALGASAKGSLTVTGQWTASASGAETIGARLETVGDNGATYLVAEGQVTTSLANGTVNLGLTVNDATTPAAVSLGGTLHYALTYRTADGQTVEGAEVRVRFDSPLIDWANVRPPDSGRVDGDSIVWQSQTTPALVKVLPSSQGELRWDIPLVTANPGRAIAAITATPQFTYHRLNGAANDRTVVGTPLVVPVNGPVSLAVEARYFDSDGQAAGSGPLPPKVGAATTYRLTWRITNASHDLTRVTVIGVLPPGVQLAATPATVESGQWHPNGRAPGWDLATLGAGLAPEASFFVILTPGADAAGRTLSVSGQTTLTATDAVTGGALTVSGNTATTNLDADTVAHGQGVVAAR